MATDLLDNTTRLIGITGGIGCGKSVVSRICRLRGFDVYDCDSEAKMLMDNDPLLKSAIVEILGRDILLSDGSLDRKIMAALIFSDDCKRRKVNTAVHSAVKADIS